jgi:hypothetical protein
MASPEAQGVVYRQPRDRVARPSVHPPCFVKHWFLELRGGLGSFLLHGHQKAAGWKVALFAGVAMELRKASLIHQVLWSCPRVCFARAAPIYLCSGTATSFVQNGRSAAQGGPLISAGFQVTRGSRGTRSPTSRPGTRLVCQVPIGFSGRKRASPRAPTSPEGSRRQSRRSTWLGQRRAWRGATRSATTSTYVFRAAYRLPPAHGRQALPGSTSSG